MMNQSTRVRPRSPHRRCTRCRRPHGIRHRQGNPRPKNIQAGLEASCKIHLSSRAGRSSSPRPKRSHHSYHPYTRHPRGNPGPWSIQGWEEPARMIQRGRPDHLSNPDRRYIRHSCQPCRPRRLGSQRSLRRAVEDRSAHHYTCRPRSSRHWQSMGRTQLPCRRFLGCNRRFRGIAGPQGCWGW